MRLIFDSSQDLAGVNDLIFKVLLCGNRLSEVLTQLGQHFSVNTYLLVQSTLLVFDVLLQKFAFLFFLFLFYSNSLLRALIIVNSAECL